MVTPSGATRARNSPFRARAKFVWSGKLRFVRFLPEAKTTNASPSLKGTPGGNCHFRRSRSSSVRYHPPRSDAPGPEFVISIQSENSPSSSASVVTLSAMNSEMNGALRATLPPRRTKPNPPTTRRPTTLLRCIARARQSPRTSASGSVGGIQNKPDQKLSFSADANQAGRGRRRATPPRRAPGRPRRPCCQLHSEPRVPHRRCPETIPGRQDPQSGTLRQS